MVTGASCGGVPGDGVEVGGVGYRGRVGVGAPAPLVAVAVDEAVRAQVEGLVAADDVGGDGPIDDVLELVEVVGHVRGVS